MGVRQYTVLEAAAKLGVHPDTVRRGIKAGKIVATYAEWGHRAQLISAGQVEKLRRGLRGGASA